MTVTSTLFFFDCAADGGSKLLKNVGNKLPTKMASYPKLRASVTRINGNGTGRG